MSLSRINVSLFKGHPTHSASTSKARLSGASIQETLGKVDGLVCPLGQNYIKSLSKRISNTECFILEMPRLG